MKESMIQVGMNLQEGVILLRVPDFETPDVFIVQQLSPAAARSLAEWLDDGVPSKMLRITDGRRWVECELSSAVAKKLAVDLRSCARRISSS